MFDAHNHLDRCEDPHAEARLAARSGICGMLVAGVDPDGWEAQARLADLPGVVLAYGLHPCAVAAMDDAAVERGKEWSTPPARQLFGRGRPGTRGAGPSGRVLFGYCEGSRTRPDTPASYNAPIYRCETPTCCPLRSGCGAQLLQSQIG